MGSRRANTNHVPKNKRNIIRRCLNYSVKRNIHALLKEVKDVDETTSIGSSFHSRGASQKQELK